MKNLKTDEERMKNADLIKAWYRVMRRDDGSLNKITKKENEIYKQSK